MGQQVAKTRNRELVVAEQDALLRHEANIGYSIIDRNARQLLARDLKQVIDAVFDGLPANRTRLHYLRDYLSETVDLLAKESHDTLILRKAVIQVHLNSLTDLMQSIYLYGHTSKNFVHETLLSWDLNLLIKGINKATKRKQGILEFGVFTSIDAKSPLYFWIDTTLMSLPLRAPFNYKEMGTSRADRTKEVEAKKEQEAWLANLSPDLFAEYKETEDRINEVSPLVTTPEDEYFIEQIESDYYPHIFESLRKVSHRDADFSYKETVVVESIKQFKIIQLGLQRIMDATVARNLNSIRSQTDFLMNKVLGENALTLTPEKQNETLNATLEEAHRVREELYKQHVAPILKKNRKEYEDRLAKQEEAARLARSEYKEALSRKDDSHKKAITVLEQDQRTELMTVSAAYVREISGLKQEHSSAIHRLEREHVSAITELFKKYQALQQQIDSMEAPDFYVKGGEAEKAKQLAEDYREKLVTYQIQISDLNDQIHKLEDFVTDIIRDEAYIDRDKPLCRDSEDHDYESPVTRPSTPPEWKSLQSDDDLVWDEIDGYLADEGF